MVSHAEQSKTVTPTNGMPLAFRLIAGPAVYQQAAPG